MVLLVVEVCIVVAGILSVPHVDHFLACPSIGVLFGKLVLHLAVILLLLEKELFAADFAIVLVFARVWSPVALFLAFQALLVPLCDALLLCGTGRDTLEHLVRDGRLLPLFADMGRFLLDHLEVLLLDLHLGQNPGFRSHFHLRGGL